MPALIVLRSPMQRPLKWPGALGGVGRLGENPVSEVINSAAAAAGDLFATVSGQKSAQQAQAAQIELARLQTQRLVAEEQRLALQTQARAEASSGFFQALPYLAGGALLLAVVAAVARR